MPARPWDQPGKAAITVLLLRYYCQGAYGKIPAAHGLFAAMGRNIVAQMRSPRVGSDIAFGFAHVHDDGVSRRHLSTGTPAVKMKPFFSRSKMSRRLSVRSDGDAGRITNVAIVGGGLAGISVAYHLLDVVSSKAKTYMKGVHVTIYDKSMIGEDGASSVAGGLMHPFSPRGKLIAFGLEALDHADNLTQMASKHQPQCILRHHLYRVGLSNKNLVQLQHTAENYPNLATWTSKEELRAKFGLDALGGIELGNGCKVIHVPSYLRGLWKECEMKVKETKGSIKWKLIDMPSGEQQHFDDPSGDLASFSQQLAHYDAVILSAGAGILHDQLISRGDDLPVQLVRGQSIEISLPEQEDSYDNINPSNNAFLCGKYVSPLPPDTVQQKVSSSQRFYIGATHEFKAEALSPNKVIEELKSQTYPLAKHLWDHGTVDRLTSGVRMQSQRGSFGRMPIIGRYSTIGRSAIGHQNLWIFTGLSSRGLIYHGLFGCWLADAVLCGDEQKIRSHFAEFDWWRKR